MQHESGRPRASTIHRRGRAPNWRRAVVGAVAAATVVGLALASATGASGEPAAPDTATGDGVITLSMSVEPGQPVPLELIRKKAEKMFDRQGFTGQGVDVAIIDSGVTPVRGLDQPGKLIHGPDLSNEAGFDGLAHLDTFGHGTHLAGIIAGDDGDQVLGIAPDSRIVSLKVAGATGETHVAQVIAAIDWVVEHQHDNGLNIRVLNLSLGVPGIKTSAGDPLSAAVERAWKSGIVVVAAAGNRGNTVGGVDSPAVSPYVMAVGATESFNSWGRGDRVASWTSGGNQYRTPDVLAPGRSILSFRVPGSFLDQAHPNAVVGDRYFVGSGTSQAAAVQSGYVAALLSRNPSLTPDQVKYAFTKYAKDVLPGKLIDGDGKINPKATARRNEQAARRAPVQSYPPAIVPGRGAPLGPTWAGGEWNGATWSGGTWSGASWSGASWSGASWSGASWSGASWSGASWSGASWSGASWSGASWSGASWSSVAWSAGGATVVPVPVETPHDALLEQEDVIYDRIEAVDDTLIDELLENEDDLYDTMLTNSDAIAKTLLAETNPAHDPTIVADVALVETVIEGATEEVTP